MGLNFQEFFQHQLQAIRHDFFKNLFITFLRAIGRGFFTNFNKKSFIIILSPKAWIFQKSFIIFPRTIAAWISFKNYPRLSRLKLASMDLPILEDLPKGLLSSILSRPKIPWKCALALQDLHSAFWFCLRSSFYRIVLEYPMFLQ